MRRPVLFGEGGLPTVTYEADAIHASLGVVIEVEAGRGACGHVEYRDLAGNSLIVDADFMVLDQPIAYQFKSSGREGVERAYWNTADLLTAIYASQRLRLPFQGGLLAGY